MEVKFVLHTDVAVEGENKAEELHVEARGDLSGEIPVNVIVQGGTATCTSIMLWSAHHITP